MRLLRTLGSLALLAVTFGAIGAGEAAAFNERVYSCEVEGAIGGTHAHSVLNGNVVCAVQGYHTGADLLDGVSPEVTHLVPGTVNLDIRPATSPGDCPARTAELTTASGQLRLANGRSAWVGGTGPALGGKQWALETDLSGSSWDPFYSNTGVAALTLTATSGNLPATCGGWSSTQVVGTWAFELYDNR